MATGRTRGETTEETRRRLIAAAADVFLAQGFANARLEDIARRAGYTRGAFHWHFASKEELLLAVLRERLVMRVGATDEVVATSTGPLAFNAQQQRRSAAVPFAERRRWALLMMEFWIAAANNDSLLAEAAKLKAELRDATARQVEQLAHAAGIRLPAPVDLLASALMALDDGFALQELLDNEAVPQQTLWDTLDLLTRALIAMSQA